MNSKLSFVSSIVKCSVKLNTASAMSKRGITTMEVIRREKKFGCPNYDPMPVALSKGEGIYVWDVEGKKYYDFLSGYSGVNFGHSHPTLVKKMESQIHQLHHTSRAFYNDVFGEFAEKICTMFGYDKVLPMNTGVECCESAVKIARKWGYEVKNIPIGEAIVVFAEGNFWGRSLSAVSSSTDKTSFEGFQPLMTGFQIIPFNDRKALKAAVKNPNVCGFMVEPIQGEAGVVVPDTGYMAEVRRLCRKHDVLWIADEVQTGLGRTGKRICVDYEDVKPDLLLLGKSLAGGLYPVSCVLGNNQAMNVLTPGTHGSTFGGNPLGTQLAISVLDIINDEKLLKDVRCIGEYMRNRLGNLRGPVVLDVRGKGLMNALILQENGIDAANLSMLLKDAGILTKKCRKNILRMTPPLIITQEDMAAAMDLVERVILKLNDELNAPYQPKNNNGYYV